MTVMDSHWLELCRDGDSLAVERLVGTHQQDVYRLALSILDDSHEAEDATQEIFLAALMSLDSFHGAASFKTWLYAIAVNTCRNRLRRHQARERLQQIIQGLFHVENGRQVQPEESAIQNESNARVWDTVQNLDEKHRLPIILRYYHDLPVAEIAEILKIPPGTVHSRLNTARAHLRQVLKEGQP
jgi:RNA polymerase sigma-70 factor, ECF subfamily